MNPNDVQSTIRAYSVQVGQRLPPGHDAHDLGQALVQEVNSEMPVPDMSSLIRSFFEKDALGNNRWEYLMKLFKTLSETYSDHCSF